MNEIIQQFGPELIERYNLVLRLLLAAALGGMIGLEREASGKPAGFRTNLLICVGAALITEVSYFVSLAGGPTADPGRIAAQVVSGIGFLGAGSIMHARGGVTGLTTAATLWVVAAIGMAVGARAYLAAMVVTSLVMLALMVLGRVEDHLIPRRPSDRNIMVTLLPPADNLVMIADRLSELGFSAEMLRAERNGEGILATFQVKGDGKKWDEALHSLLGIEGVRKIDLA